MRNKTPEVAAFHKMAHLLEAILEAGPSQSVTATAEALNMPVATAHRHVATMVSAGWLAPVARGRHVAGKQLLDLLHRVDEKQILATVAAPLLDRLAVRTKSIVQLGTLENDMVTYRVKTGQGAGDLFTKVGMQLEAYCSAIGKVLLAHLPEAERNAYLAAGPFVALTRHTVTDPQALALEFARAREQGFAEDREEVALGLRCLAMPIRSNSGMVIAAVSVSRAAAVSKPSVKALQAALQQTVQEIEVARPIWDAQL